MATKKSKNQETEPFNPKAAASVGTLLLMLRNALQQVEFCRVALHSMGYSQKRWQEIMNDVNPELRFVLQPKMLDSIIAYLKGVGKRVHRNKLARDLYAQGAGPLQRIRHSITTNLRSGNLTLDSRNKVGLPAWKKKQREVKTEGV